MERRTHDYKRQGTTTLSAAIDVATGAVIGSCMRRNRARKFCDFLDEVERNVPADDVPAAAGRFRQRRPAPIRKLNENS